MKDVALFEPNVTADTFVKPVPVITTPLPPVGTPPEGLKPETVGAAT